MTLSVTSATTLSATGCPYGTAARSFGTVLPGTNAVTAAPCSVLFGSTNDTSSLRLLQSDGVGTAMFRMSGGTADTGWGPLGRRVFSIGGTDNAFDVAVQRDGKIVVVGTTAGNGFVARYLTNGTFDPAFNGNTPLIIDRGTANDIVMAVDIAWDGSIAIAGHTAPGVSKNAFVGKLTTTGAPDPTFGAIKTFDPYGTEDGAESVAFDSLGRIVVAGSTVNTQTRFMASRWRADGTLDPTFNTTGFRDINVNGYSFALDVVTTPTNGVVMVGTASGTNLDYALVVLNEAGADEPTFVGSATGRQVVSLAAGDDTAQGVSMQADGKFVLGGSSIDGVGAERVGVARVNATGGVDSTFGGGAQRLSYSSSNEYAEGVLVQPDGGVLLSGAADNYTNAGLLRLTSSGQPDATFDTDGKLVLNGGAGNDGLGRPAIGADGRIIVAGDVNGDTQVLSLLGSQYPDFAGAWTGSRFAACLETLSAGTNTWPVAGSNNCVIATPANWRGIAAQSGDATAIVAQTASGTATAALRFGLQVDPVQSPGTYSAPLTFEVVAPM
ncbi:MAG: hypothetical protein JWL76_2308 [Thermoleophilia bacterium]|nr:hypothetical protein [Thermoleophilia bacterium]